LERDGGRGDGKHPGPTSTSCRLGIVIAGAPAGFGCTARPYPTAPAAGRQGLCLSFSCPFPVLFRLAKKGSVVLVPLPFSDLAQARRRPAAV